MLIFFSTKRGINISELSYSRELALNIDIGYLMLKKQKKGFLYLLTSVKCRPLQLDWEVCFSICGILSSVVNF